MPASTSGRMRALDQRLDALDQLVAGIDVDAGVAICIAVRFALFIGHVA